MTNNEWLAVNTLTLLLTEIHKCVCYYILTTPQTTGLTWGYSTVLAHLFQLLIDFWVKLKWLLLPELAIRETFPDSFHSSQRPFEMWRLEVFYYRRGNGSEDFF